MTLTKALLAQHLYRELGLNKHEASGLVDLFFGEIKDSLERGEQVKLSGFGSLKLRDKSSRPSRNPKTGEAATIKARRVVTFKLGVTLKERVFTNTASLTKSLKEGQE